MSLGLIAIGAAICVAFGCLSAIGESWICCHAIDGMVDYLNTSHKDLMDALRTNKAFDDALTKGFIDAIKDYKSSRQ